jgi:hypothetical protein
VTPSSDPSWESDHDPTGASPHTGRYARIRFAELGAQEFQVDSGASIPAGIDGEALRLDPPIRFRSLPGALRVRSRPRGRTRARGTAPRA